MPKYIVYACPTGEMAEQLSVYFEKSRIACGPNAAHQYMPHCTLTGFFEDVPGAVPQYTQKLERSLKRFRRSQPDPVIKVKDLVFRADWHGLELSSEWLKKLTVDFVCTATSPTRSSRLRPKDWLHLSLAYDFPPNEVDTLETLAVDLIDPQTPVGWDLRFYQQNPDKSWLCHRSLRLSAMDQ